MSSYYLLSRVSIVPLFGAALFVVCVGGLTVPPAHGQELIEDGIDIESVSIGTFQGVQAGGTLSEGQAMGMNIYISVEPKDDAHGLGRPLQMLLRAPDGTEERIRQNFVGEGLSKVWISKSLHEGFSESPDEAFAPVSGTYEMTVAIDAEDEEFGLTTETTFELSEEEVHARLEPVPVGGVDYDVSGEEVALEWEGVEGATSYHVILRTDDNRTHQDVTSNTEHTFHDVNADPERVSIDAYSAPPSGNFQGEIDTPPVNLQEGQVLHRSRTTVDWR